MQWADGAMLALGPRPADWPGVSDLPVDEFHAVVLGEDSRFTHAREVVDREAVVACDCLGAMLSQTGKRAKRRRS